MIGRSIKQLITADIHTHPRAFLVISDHFKGKSKLLHNLYNRIYTKNPERIGGF
jgi:hypothetical protein